LLLNKQSIRAIGIEASLFHMTNATVFAAIIAARILGRRHINHRRSPQLVD
jgi:hypothetical protein